MQNYNYAKNSYIFTIPVTTFLIDGIEVIPLFDPPHLIKGIRNNLLPNTKKKIIKKLQFVIEIDGKEELMTARWDEIQSAFIIHKYGPKDKDDKDDDKKWKLTSAHVYEEEMSKMKVKVAAQVLSNTVADFLIKSSMKNLSMFL